MRVIFLILDGLILGYFLALAVREVAVVMARVHMVLTERKRRW